jgi:hypothetical protein
LEQRPPDSGEALKILSWSRQICLYMDRDPLREEAKIAGASRHAPRPLIGDAHFDAGRCPQAHRDVMFLEAGPPGSGRSVSI